MTNIIFRPRVSWGDTESNSNSLSATFNSDPFQVLTNPNDYLDDLMDDDTDEMLDKLKKITVNASNNQTLTDSKSLSANASLQFNRKLGTKGRNITLRLMGGYGDNDNDQYSMMDTRYFQTSETADPILRYITTPLPTGTIQHA